MKTSKLYISEIDTYLSQKSPDNLDFYIKQFEDDIRVGVKKILLKYKKKHQKYIQEKNRIEQISKFEKFYAKNGFELIAGVDEVGRGPLAGPVVATCVILPKNCNLLYIDDSKKLSSKLREDLSSKILENAIDVSTSIIDNNTIDEINIHNATILAMRQAITNLKIKPDIALIDFVQIPNLEIKTKSITKGDRNSISIAAASIVAKVIRDKIMMDYAKIYTQYDFENNKGYPTQKHINAIKKYGTIPLHRKSFLKKYGF